MTPFDDQRDRLDGDARLELADVTREVIDQLASSTADSEAFAAARDLLRDAVALLRSAPHGRPYEEAEASLMTYQQHKHIDHSPFIGPLNPLAPPIEMTINATEVTGLVVFGDAYEGPPGCVHGGVIAAAFDEVLGFAQGLSGAPGMTARLTINYRSPTPLHRQLRFRADIERIDGRKIYARGELRVVDDDRLCAEADGLFLSMRTDMFTRLMEGRA